MTDPSSATAAPPRRRRRKQVLIALGIVVLLGAIPVLAAWARVAWLSSGRQFDVVDAPTRRERRGEVGALGRSEPSQPQQLAPIGHRLLPRGPGVGGPGRSQTGAIVGHERDGITLMDAASYSAA